MINCQLVVALAAEARPLIDHFHLKQIPGSTYRTYANGHLSLVESGIGKVNAAGATAAALTRHSIEDNGATPVCLNIGVAGADRPIGEIVAAHRINDASCHMQWYPQLTWNPPCATAALTTLDEPSDQYQRNRVFEMEASGFVRVASKFTTMEFIQCLKIISDNCASPVDAFEKSKVSQLVKDQLPVIEQSIQRLSMLATVLPDTMAVNRLTTQLSTHLHVSASQKVILRQLLQRTQARTGSLPVLAEIEKTTDIKTLLQALQNSLDANPQVY